MATWQGSVNGEGKRLLNLCTIFDLICLEGYQIISQHHWRARFEISFAGKQTHFWQYPLSLTRKLRTLRLFHRLRSQDLMAAEKHAYLSTDFVLNGTMP